MDISLFLTSQNATAKSQEAAEKFEASLNSDLNKSGFFGALVEQMNAQIANSDTAKIAAAETPQSNTLATTLSVGEDGEILPSSLLSMSGEDLLALLRSAVPEDQQDSFEVIKAGENSLSLSIKGSDTDDAMPFILNGFFQSADVNGDAEAMLSQYKDQLSDALQEFLAKAQSLVSNQSAAGSLLGGYTPENITDIGDKIAAILTKLSAKDYADNGRAGENGEEIAALIETSSEELSAITGLVQGFLTLQSPTGASGEAHTLTDFGHTQYRGAGDTIPADAELAPELGKTTAKDGAANIGKDTTAAAKANSLEFTQLLSSLTATLPTGLALGGYSELGLEQLGLSTMTSPLAQTGFTSALTQAQSAAHAHPATNLVSATIKKAAMGGEQKAITIQLDPAELGRVEVKMNFGKDKTVKAVITVEKPETFMMMQRDASTLERALQEAGLDTQGGLSFELAEHGFEFDQHNQRGGGHDKGGTGAGSNDNEDEVLIESEMTWRVDPDTGHMRYNILA